MVLTDQNGESIELDARDVPVLCGALRDSAAELPAAESAASRIEQAGADDTLELGDDELEAVRTVLASLPSKRN